MNDCAVSWVRECLPEYLHGTLKQRERLLVQAHLALCEECSSELVLLERCRVSMAVVPTIDVARVVAMLPSPSPRELIPGQADRRPSTMKAMPIRSLGGSGWRGAGWRMAAAALLMVGTAGVLFTRGGHWPAADGLMAPISYVASSNTGVTDSASGTGDSALLASQMDPELPGGRPAFSLSGGLSALSDDALSALLLEVDAVEALPLIDPPSMGAFSVTEQTGAE